MLNNSTIFRNGNCGRGTVGGFFTMTGSPNVYGISNNHVIANLNSCNVGDPIFNAGNIQIGALSHWITLQGNGLLNTFDTGIFQYAGAEPVAWRMPVADLAKPVGYIDPRPGGHVYMMLENNAVRTGVITSASINFTVNFYLCGSLFSFTHIIEIAPFDNLPFSVPGESGSIVMASNHCITGLLIGTNVDRTRSYAVPFVDGILKFFPLII